MKLSDLIQHVGDENVECQIVSQSLISAKVKKGMGELTIATDQAKVMNLGGIGRAKHVGLLVWLPADRLPTDINPTPTPS
ncbi:hypothetical protein [Ruficoccus sp. ZRK36]|uniref:hypothetical protein n=1 Tax=Ruficoccus sp. ZRK36 TaxID=2866311 RepID=UPI001C732771|nr:hypothetical protein [Ruficoccus sp. ZRK36]QYY35286.1 hypothetical protein K0V07_13415 [Ruficoccus sp. ZRK36]